MNRKEYLSTAEDVICKQRPDVHGHPEDAFQLVADYWTTFLAKKFDIPTRLAAADVAMMMALFKTARWQMNPRHSDNIVDNIGYLALAGELTDGEDRLT